MEGGGKRYGKTSTVHHPTRSIVLKVQEIFFPVRNADPNQILYMPIISAGNQKKQLSKIPVKNIPHVRNFLSIWRKEIRTG